MPLEPQIGKPAGQVYNIERAFGTFLGQMAESGASLGSMVLKELLQNADDAGATEMSERPPYIDLPPKYLSLCGPALLTTARRLIPRQEGLGMRIGSTEAPPAQELVRNGSKPGAR